MSFLYFLIIGALAGWLGSQLFKGRGSGLIMNIILGIVGAIVGGWVFGLFGLTSDGSFIGSLITAAVGAVIVLWIASLISGKR